MPYVEPVPDSYQFCIRTELFETALAKLSITLNAFSELANLLAHYQLAKVADF